MFGFGKKRSSITVEFYEQGVSKPLAVSTLDLAQLPDTFQIRTTLNFRGEAWQVSKAIPATKEKNKVAMLGRARVTQ